MAYSTLIRYYSSHRDELPGMDAIYWGSGRWRDRAHFERAALFFERNAEMWAAMFSVGAMLIEPGITCDKEQEILDWLRPRWAAYWDSLPDEAKEAWI